jgi:prepilin-type N-terminal cleavage/methylation domain-containing protein
MQKSKYKNLNFKLKKGFTLVELVLSITIFVMVAASVAVPVIGNYISDLENQKYVQANAILNESWEAVRSIRSRGWGNITNQVYGLTKINDYWEFTGTPDVIDGFTRTITVTDAERDLLGNLVDSGGTSDPDTKRVAIRITWQPTPYDTRQLEAESLLTNYLNPGIWPL